MRSVIQTEIETVIERFIRDDSLDTEFVDNIDYDENLFTSGILDSMGIMRLITHLQSKYEYKIHPKDLIPENFRTIRVMAGFLALQLTAQSIAEENS